MRARLRWRRPSPAFVIACIALFVAMSGVAYAANTVRSRDIVNDAVTSADIKGGGGRTGDIKNRDVNALLAVAKGFGTVRGQNNNGAATVLNYGGQQTSTNNGVTAQRIGTGIYDVTFNANTGTGKYVNVNSVDDLAVQVTGRNGFSTGSVFDAASSANENQIKLRVFMRRPNNGTLIDSSL